MKSKIFEFPINRAKNFQLSALEHKKGTGGIIHRRPSQIESNNICIGKPFSMDTRPTGSGKSVAIRFLSLNTLLNNPNLRIIVAAPYILNCIDFLEPLELVFENELDRFKPKWNPIWDTTDFTPDGSINHVLNFLKQEPSKNSINERILITPHASLVYAFQRSPESFKNCLICIDEAHHIKFDEDDIDDEDIEVINQLGKLVEYAVTTHNTNNINLHLTTATYCRSDKLAIVKEEHEKLFVKFSMPYSRYLSEECKYLENLSYSFNLYETSPLESLMEELKTFSKFIGYIEHGSIEEKPEKVKQYLKAISQSNSPKWKENDNGTISVWRGRKEYIGINLVEENNRMTKYKYVMEAHNGNVPLDFILSLRCFVEGANYKQAQKMFIIGYKSSITQLLQMIGRLTRDCEGKPNVEVVHILPQMFDKNKTTDYIDKFDDYLKTIIMVMEQLPVVFYPQLPKQKRENGDNDDEPQQRERPSNLLMELLGNNGDYDTVVRELDIALLKLWAAGVEGEQLIQDFKCDADEILSDNGIEDEKIIERVVEEFLDNREKRRKKFLEMSLGTYMEDLRQFKFVTGHKFVGDLLYLLSDGVNEEKLKALRDYVIKRFGTWESRYELLKEFYNKYGHYDIDKILKESGVEVEE